MLRTILVADDSPTIRKIVELTFVDSEFRVEAVGTGREALELIERLQPDVVLADVVMPEPNGYEICRAIKGSERQVPVVLLAGTFEPFDRNLAAECGADAHLIKPFESTTLRAKVRELLEPKPVTADEPEAQAEAESPTHEALEQLDETPAAATVAPPSTGQLPAEAEAPDADAAVEAPSPALVEAVARAVVQRLSRDVLRDVAWEVVPKLATEIIRDRIRELEREGSGDES